MKFYKEDDGASLSHWCPGCDCPHTFRIRQINGVGPVWNFDGNFEKPTVTPSIKVTYHTQCVCHYFITNGELVYCNDTYHEYAGKKIELPDYPENWL